MRARCENPDCNSPDTEMRALTEEEMRLLLAEADEMGRSVLRCGRARVMVCNVCNTWTFEESDAYGNMISRGWIYAKREDVES